jgi:hypothetical protein
MAISNLLTGRVRVVSPKNVTSDRYQFLDLSQAEPNLGVPPFSASLLTNPAIIVSDDQGNRGFAKKLFLEEFSGSFSGSFQGDGSKLTNVPSVVAPFIASGSATASFKSNGLNVNTDTIIEGNLYVSKSIVADQLIVNIISSSVIYSSGSNIFGDELTDIQQFTGSVEVRDRIGVNQITGSSISASFTGSFFGDGTNLFNLPKATRLASGSVTASVSPDAGFVVTSIDSGSTFTGSLFVSGNITIPSGSGFFSGSGEGLFNIPESALSFQPFRIISGSVTASVSPIFGFKVESAISGSEFTGSVDISGSVSASLFRGDGSGLFNIPALTSTLIASGSATASISPNKGVEINTSVTINDYLLVTGSGIFKSTITASMFSGSGRGLFDIPRSALTPDALTATIIATGSVTASVSSELGFQVISSLSGSQFTGSLFVSGGNIRVATGSFFSGSGAGLSNIPRNALTEDALLSNIIASGSVSASVSPNDGFKVTSITSGSTFTGSLFVSGNIELFTGSFSGSGDKLFNIPITALKDLDLSRITSGSATASISPDKGFVVNTFSTFSGSMIISASAIYYTSESLDTIFNVTNDSTAAYRFNGDTINQNPTIT